jgi:hypothetical protein
MFDFSKLGLSLCWVNVFYVGSYSTLGCIRRWELSDIQSFDVEPFNVQSLDTEHFDVQSFGIQLFGVRSFDVRPFDVRSFDIQSLVESFDIQ